MLKYWVCEYQTQIIIQKRNESCWNTTATNNWPCCFDGVNMYCMWGDRRNGRHEPATIQYNWTCRLTITNTLRSQVNKWNKWAKHLTCKHYFNYKCIEEHCGQGPVTASLVHIWTCVNSEAKLRELTSNQLLQLMSDPLTSWWCWPARQSQTPVPAHGGQQNEPSRLRPPRLARYD